jgi:hypothetical protein
MAKKESKTQAMGGVVFVGAMFIGMGVGFLLNAIAVGLFIGMGVGFLLMAAVSMVDKK